MANKITTQSGKCITSIGGEDSMIRIEAKYDITVPKLIQRIHNSNAWSNIQDTSLYRDLGYICEDDNIDKSEFSKLIKTAFHYAEQC